MSQSGFTPLQIYSSSTPSNVPLAANLSNSTQGAELAINIADGKLFYKNSSGVVTVLATNGTAVIGGSNTQVQYNNGGVLAGSANMTFNGTSLTLANDATIHGLTVGQGLTANLNNSAFGLVALSNNSTGSNNTALGYATLQQNVAGVQNTAVGSTSLNVNTGNANTAIGYIALVSNTSGASNVAVGVSALNSNTTASQNTGIGYQSLFSNTTASNNTAVGYQAGYSNTTGGGNVHIGYQAGNTTTTGGQQVIIGYNSIASAVGDNYEIVIGPGLTGKGTTTGFISPAGGAMYQGNNSTLWAITSDQRLKKNIVDNTIGLDAITKIQVRNFEYRFPEEITELPKSSAINIQGVQLGPIAQELAQVLPDCVKTESTGVMSVDASNITWHLVNAIKELNAKITALEAKLGA